MIVIENTNVGVNLMSTIGI